MKSSHQFEIFLATAPGLEPALCAEVGKKGFKHPKAVPGGVITMGGWPEVWRANLWIRGAGRVLARIGTFRVLHLAELDSRTREIPWSNFLRADVPFRVAVTCIKSKIYHSDAAAERIETAIKYTLGAVQSDEADICVHARIERDICTISLDTSGDLLHKRGYKEATHKAPIRETMAALFLEQCGYDGKETLLDPMCGSGTFVIEAAEIAARLNPGRARHFAFESFSNFDAEAWQKMRAVKSERIPKVRLYGNDRDAGAVKMSRANAERAGVSEFVEFHQGTISALPVPEGSPGLIIVNPPYGTRLGEKKKLFSLYQALGETLLEKFQGWRIGLITTDEALARTTKLHFLPPSAPVQHGGLRVTLFQTSPLAHRKA